MNKIMMKLLSLLMLFWTFCMPISSGAETITNSIGQTFNLVFSGTFMIGSPNNELGRYKGEPQIQVTLTKSYYIQTTEVTQAQWKTVMGTNPSRISGCPECPVERVSWNDAQDFIKGLNLLEKTDKYRLPTDAEWEYAARAGSTTAFANGDITEKGLHYDPNLDQIGWYLYNSDHRTHEVGQKQANAWGLYDMHGNVWEWVQDWLWYHSKPPAALTDPKGPSSSIGRIRRGGSWNSGARDCRSANRHYNRPDFKMYDIGFRIVKDP